MLVNLRIFFTFLLSLFCQAAMAANPPTTISPGSGSSPGVSVGSLTPTFSWNAASGATGYGLYIRDMTAAGTPIVYPNSSAIMPNPLTGTSFIMPPGYLVNGHTYRWNMTSFVGSTEGSTVSTVLYFQTPAASVNSTLVSSPTSGNTAGTVAATPSPVVVPNPPTIAAPGGVSSPGPVVASLTPTFGWNSVSGATGYGLYIRDMTAPGTPLIYPNASGITYSPINGVDFNGEAMFQMPANILVNGHTYRWNMTSFTGSRESSAVSGSLYFQTPSVAVSTPATPSPGSGTSTATTAVNPPTLVSPGTAASPGAMLSSLTPEFRWNYVNGATGYGLYIRDMTAAGTPLVYPKASGSPQPVTVLDIGFGPSFSLPPGFLVNGHIYRWNMTSFNGSTESISVSSVLYFQTPPVVANTPTTSSAIGATPAGTIAVSPPTTISPGYASSPGMMTDSLTPVFRWNAANGATGYGLYIRDMTTFGAPMVYPNSSGTTANPLTGTSLTLPPNVLANGHTYRWNMTSFNGATEILAASSVLYFQTPAAASTPPSSGNSSGTATANPTPIAITSSGNAPNTTASSPTQTSNGNSASSGKADWNTAIGTFNGVTAYSNGSGDHESPRGQYGLDWQCAEYVNRYYSQIYGINLGGQNAADFYPNASSRKLTSYPNGGTVPPQVGDILCFTGGADGHVAIITQVSSTQVIVIQQNVAENSRDAAYSFPMSIIGGRYLVDGSRLSSVNKYTCQGWLRKPMVGASSSNSGILSGTEKTISTSTPQVSSSVVAPASQSVVKATLLLNAMPNTGGVVSGGGDFAIGSSLTVTATSRNGFVFENWTENGNVVSSSASYNFTFKGSRILEAHFRSNPMNRASTPNSPPDNQNRPNPMNRASAPNSSPADRNQNRGSIINLRPNSSRGTNQVQR